MKLLISLEVTSGICEHECVTVLFAVCSTWEEKLNTLHQKIRGILYISITVTINDNTRQINPEQNEQGARELRETTVHLLTCSHFFPHRLEDHL